MSVAADPATSARAYVGTRRDDFERRLQSLALIFPVLDRKPDRY